MSVIERVRVLRVPVPLSRPFITNVRRADQIDVVLVEATGTDGRIGWGEAAASWRVTGESPESVAAAVSGPLGGAVLGQSAREPSTIDALQASVWGNAAARSAVECAVLDLDAQQQGLPLASPPGTDAAPRRIRTDMTLSAAAPAELAERAAAHVSDGFRCLKVKASAGTDTVAGLRAIRAAVGESIELRVDANQAWDAGTAIRIIRESEDAGLALAFVEQPVAAHDLDALAQVADAVSTPIMADESVRTARDVRAIAERAAAALVNIKLAKTGGLREAQAAARTAQDAGLGVIFGCMMEAHVGVSAAAQLAAALSPDVVHDLDAAQWLRASPVIGGAVFDADEIILPAGGGLGIAGLAADAEAVVLADVRTSSRGRIA